MCLTLDARFPGIYRAGYDILVWKRLREGWRQRLGQYELVSPYQQSRYVIDERKIDGNFLRCTLGRMGVASREETSRLHFHRGLHAYTNQKRAKAAASFDTVYPAIIPKGALFMIGRNYEVVCDQLIVKSRGWDKGQAIPEKGDFSKHKRTHKFESFVIRETKITEGMMRGRTYKKMGWRVKP